MKEFEKDAFQRCSRSNTDMSGTRLDVERLGLSVRKVPRMPPPLSCAATSYKGDEEGQLTWRERLLCLNFSLLSLRCLETCRWVWSSGERSGLGAVSLCSAGGDIDTGSPGPRSLTGKFR